VGKGGRRGEQVGEGFVEGVRRAGLNRRGETLEAVFLTGGVGGFKEAVGK
jgi:hypothetical protein